MNRKYEKNIHKAIIKALNENPCAYVWKRRAAAFEKGRADITGAICGFRVEIEVKRSGENLTPIQEKWLEKMAGLNCITGPARSVEDALYIVEDFFENLTLEKLIYRY